MDDLSAHLQSPIIYGTKGAVVADYKTNKVQLYKEFDEVQDIEEYSAARQSEGRVLGVSSTMDGDAPLCDP